MPSQQSHTFASRFKPTYIPKLAKECACSTQEEFQNIFSNPSKKIKTPYPQAMTDKHSDNSVQTIYRQRNLTRTTEANAHNKGLPKAGVTSFYDSFVLNQTLVFQMNGSAKKPRLWQAEKRYVIIPLCQSGINFQ